MPHPGPHPVHAAARRDLLATLLATRGCATIPSSGPVGSAPIPAPPPWRRRVRRRADRRRKSPARLDTRGRSSAASLLASASFAHDHGTAREYLTPGASRLWRAGPRAGVTGILASTPIVYQTTGRFSGQRKNRGRDVEVSWQELATLDTSGQYKGARGGGGGAQPAVLRLGEGERGGNGASIVPSTGNGSKVSNELLLPAAPSSGWITHPRNLYFYGQPGGQLLVPAPVFVPFSQSSDLVTTLVNDLRARSQRLAGERGGHRLPAWLAAAEDPGPGPRAARETRPRSSISGCPGRHTPVHRAGDGRSARVDTDHPGLQSPALIQAVKLKINGGACGRHTRGREHRPEPRRVGGGVTYRMCPALRTCTTWSTTGAVRMLAASRRSSVAVPGQAGTGEMPLSKIAVSANDTTWPGWPIGRRHGIRQRSGRGREVTRQPVRASAARAAHRHEGQRGQLGPPGQPVGSGQHPRPAGVRMLPGKGGTPLIVTLPPGIRRSAHSGWPRTECGSR